MAMPKYTPKTADPPKHTAKTTTSKPIGSQLPKLIQIHQPDPSQERIAKTNEQQNNKEQESNTLEERYQK